MRPEGEAPSDFQEYTLVALLAVAATLSNTPADHHAVMTNLVSSAKSCAAMHYNLICVPLPISITQSEDCMTIIAASCATITSWPSS